MSTLLLPRNPGEVAREVGEVEAMGFRFFSPLTPRSP